MASSRLSSKSLAEANLKMLDNEALCDFTLTAGKEKQDITCHKVILASRSPVFMLCFAGRSRSQVTSFLFRILSRLRWQFL
ncbi:hypothetical protein DPMN_146107 [Dreissena polymorpha]|uniref:BTB domain-containing protein n=1 Tax=Dreissena polymorpha TaxID=45954 RepID=A0A9D4F5B0_DREPO|nr:hypothetical protein DPMN_146107 [Dreissena polymorpha]